ncbi:PilX N-terminal domain-containing pilus assembly protein [Ghiorsea bivora]|uniref:PilX N-terminal domain-containing pilus assembly protein n=1 Tax=Ghiorsea bivora TaxID=1485545 RepID=UPI00056E9D13|nr:PilX N-terminal domain-containing pilus assembly protein [Ghiorsea bivora]
MKKVNFKQQGQQGFILVTSLVLLAILTLLGITAAYKTVIETKISRMAVQMDRASAAAETGLTQAYWYWVKDTVQGIADAQTLTSYVAGIGGSPIAPYEGSFTPSSIDDAAMPTDADIQSATNQFFVFNLTATGISKVANSSWGVGTTPQVAVWVTSFNNETPPAFPYQTPVDLTAGATCAAGCKMVTYALGRSGQARQLMRESQSVINNLLTGVSAMTNAPSGVNFADICNPPATPPANRDANASPWTASATGNGSTVIEVTQAPYALGSVPSGTALASNTAIGSGGKGFRNGTGSQTGATFSTVPYLLYAGHGTKTAFKVDWASVAQDTTGLDLPANLLPQKLVNAPLLGTSDQVNYFSSSSNQLFSMDTYRWAAEQFTCQTAPFTAANDGQFGNGIYCSKAEALRQSVDAIVSAASGGTVRAFAPVTGRLNIAQIQYNIANGIPMFGMVRLMFPAVPDSGVTATCNGTPTQLHVIESAGDASNGSYDFNKLMACKKKGSCANLYTGSITDPATLGGQYPFTVADGAVPDDDGYLGSNARLIVYGGLLIDYFADYNIQANPTGGSPGAGTDTVFNPADGERLLSPLESPDVYLAIEHNVMINPVMPRFMGNNPLPFPTAAPQTNPNANATSPSRLGNPAPAVGSAATNTLVSANSVNMVWS